MVGRRALLLGSGAVAVSAAAGVGATHLGAVHRLVFGSPSSPHAVPAVDGGPVLTGSFRSAARQAVTGWTIAYPPGVRVGTSLPVMVVLHGRGDSHTDLVRTHHLERFLAAAVTSGVPPFALASVDGGEHSYWHRRAAGDDAQAMVIDELLPLLAARGLRTSRVALGGWSMGGYGALLLASVLGPSRVAAVAVDSPALWTRWEDSARGAFDGRADFAAHDVLASAAALAGIPVRVSCGTSDPFLPGVKAFLRAVPSAERDLAPGAHDLAWWQHAAPGQLAFVGRHLA